MLRRFRDRAEAGRQLAEKLIAYDGRPDVLVLALPRGGVPVAFELARAQDVPLDVCVVRKLGVPGQPELAMGAIASGVAWRGVEDEPGMNGSNPMARGGPPGRRSEPEERGDRCHPNAAWTN